MANLIQGNLLRRIFLHNIGLKIISLLLAIGLWRAMARDPMPEVQIRVPIEFHNRPDQLEIDSSSVSEVQVRIRGPERLIHRLQPGDVHAEVDLGRVQVGERTFDMDGKIHVPQELEVEQVIPGQLHLSFDSRATRMVEVRPRITGNFAPGVRVAQVISDPPSVRITGPKHRIDEVQEATTDPVDASGVTSRAVFATHAYVADPLIQVAHPTLVHVTVMIEGSGDEKK